MGWEYTTADRALCEVNSFRFRIKRWFDTDINKAAGSSAAWGAGHITGCSTRASADTRGRFKQPGVGSGDNELVDIEFQFPPKVLTDGRKGNWFEGELTGGKEPVAVFKTSGPRQLSLSWTYIVDSFKADSTSWNIERITRNIRTLRGYFANARARGDGSVYGARDGLVVEFWAWCIGGSTPISARIVGIDVKYGETMVFPPASNTESGGTSAFPLRTDITIDFRLWTKLLYAVNAEGKVDAPIDPATGLPGAATNREVGLQDLDRLTDFEPPDWF